MISIPDLHRIFLQHPLITTDSRNVPKGSIFFALRGDSFDGNIYASEALTKGAAYAVVDNPDVAQSEQTILTGDVLKTLQNLANFHRENHLSKTIFIALTGSNGKTTTKELIRAVLETQFRTIATKGNLNNHIGVPLTLLSIPDDTEIAIIEMGANHPGEIHELCEIANPEIGLITNVGKAHLKGFGSFEGVIQTKTELYRFINNRGGTLFVSEANKILIQQSESLTIAKKLYYNTPELYATISNNSGHLALKVQMNGKTVDVNTRLTGKYNTENILAAIAFGLYFKVPVQSIINGIESYTPGNMRSQIVQTANSNTLLLDAYNANPTSMAAAIENLHEMAGFPKIAILGEMLELGEYSAKEHRVLLQLLNDYRIPYMLTGKQFGNIAGEGSAYFETTDELANYLKKHPIKDTCVLLKGSRSNKLEKLTELL